MTLAIVSAMPEELAALLPLLQSAQTQQHAGRVFHQGQLNGRAVVLVLAGIGKVAAAATTALLLDRFQASAVLFTGVAGGLGPHVKVGDVVVGSQFLQHDMDASPIFPRWEIPGTGRSVFDADVALTNTLLKAAQSTLEKQGAALAKAGFAAPQAHQGLIVSGDRFISSARECAQLKAALPMALAVDMESAAVAQVCADFKRPLAVLRCVSDRADDNAHVDFPHYLNHVAAPLARDVVAAALMSAR
jgi:adenosylhomocysteine nucleosidase